MKKLLILTTKFPPDKVGRANKMKARTELMLNYDWKPIFVIPHEYPVFLKKQKICKENIKIYRNHEEASKRDLTNLIETITGMITNKFKLLDRYTSHLLREIIEIDNIIQKEQPDAICTMDYPFSLHVLGLIMKNKYNLPWLMEMRDPWVKNPNHFGGDAGIIHRYFERKAVENADAIVFYEGIQMDLNYFEKTYKKEDLDKIYKFNHMGYYEKEFKVPAKQFKSFTITHAGTFYGNGHDPINFLKGLNKFIKEKKIDPKNIRVNFLGDWNEKWDEFISNLKIKESVNFYGWVNHKKVISFLKGSDLLLYFNRPYTGDELSISQKMGEYIGAQKPILTLAKKKWKSSKWMREKNLGLWADYEDIEDIKDALKKAYDTPKEKLFNPSEQFLEKISRKNNVKQFCDVLDEITQNYKI